MKTYCSCLLVLSLIVLSGCMSMLHYKEAAQRHSAYASGQAYATAAEWRALIPEFQKIIDTDPQGQMADDAQYAIGSSWVWCIKTGDTQAPWLAIQAFQELIHIYPTSQYVPQAHYWLGRCYDYVGDDYQAITQYQLVESRYPNSEVSDPARLELARVYMRQGYLTRAKTLYHNLVGSSTNQEIVVAATQELQALKTQKEPIVLPPPENEAHVQAQPQSKPQPKSEVQVQPQPKPQPKPQPENKVQVRVQPKPKNKVQAQVRSQPESRPRREQEPAAPIIGTKPLVPESLTREFGLTAKTIVIDPGHGGKDPGAFGGDTRKERIIVLSISKKLREILTQRGYTVLMTRDTNRFIPLRERTAFAIQHKADLFLSIHANGSESSKARGIETYYLDVASTDKASEIIAARENADSGYSIQELEKLLKGIIQESKSEDSRRLAGYVQQALVQATGAIDRGVKHARFVVLIGTNVPAVLIETGFVSNPTEGRKLTTPAYQHKIATAIAEGIDRFLGKTGETSRVKKRIPKLAAKNFERYR